MTKLLTKDQIEVKIKQVKSNGVLMLLYKTARTDMDILDELYGPENWQSDYREIKGNLYAGIAVRDRETGNWVWKWDCGVESRADGDGNEKKGEASDAFKRAGFKWGIGRELYTAPFIWVSTDVVPVKSDDRGHCQLANPFEKFYVSHIAYNDKNEISKLTISGKGARVVWSNAPTILPEPTPAVIDEINTCAELPQISAILRKYKNTYNNDALSRLATARKQKILSDLESRGE